MALWLSQRHKYVNCYCSIPVDFIMFSSVAKVNSVGRALVLHAELHHGTVLRTPPLLACALSWTKIRSIKQFHSLSYTDSSAFFYSCFCVETETPCSLVVSASKKSDNSEGQMQNTRRFVYTPVTACHYINLFLSSQKKFCKKRGNCGHRQCYATWRWSQRNKLDQLCRKVCIFLVVRSQSFFDASHRRAIRGEGEA